jgi:hypothetical protein
VGPVGENVEEVSQTTQDYERTKLDEDPFEREDSSAGDKVKELDGYREVRSCDQEVTHFLALLDALRTPKGITAVTIAVWEVNFSGRGI